MKDDIYTIELDLFRNSVFILDSILEVGLGICFFFLPKSGVVPICFGIVFILFGIIQLIRKLKTFHLTETEFLIRRPLFPYSPLLVSYPLSTIKEIGFVRIKGKFGGPYLTVRSNRVNGDFLIATSKVNIDRLEEELNKLGIKTTREGL